MALDGVVYFQRLADGSGVLTAKEIALKLPAGWTVVDHPTGVLTGDATNPGSVTGYLELVAAPSPTLTDLTCSTLEVTGDTLLDGNAQIDGNLIADANATIGTAGSSAVALKSDGLLLDAGGSPAAQPNAGRMTIHATAGVTISLGNNAALSAGVGTLGLYTATPVAQQTRPGQLTDSTGGTPGSTLAAIAAGAAYTQADMVAVRNALASLAQRVNALETVGHNLGETT